MDVDYVSTIVTYKYIIRYDLSSLYLKQFGKQKFEF